MSILEETEQDNRVDKIWQDTTFIDFKGEQMHNKVKVRRYFPIFIYLEAEHVSI